MKKIVWLDVGTHFAQEYTSIFGSNLWFYYTLFKRFLSSKLLRRGDFITYIEVKSLIKVRSELRKRREMFHIIFVEANPIITSSRKVYMEADQVFNIAIMDNCEERFKLVKLYFQNGHSTSQGNSIYKDKRNARPEEYVLASGVSSEAFMNTLKNYLDETLKDYSLLLRVNCEGSEDSVIYSAFNSFDSDFYCITGSLKDVKEIKGDEAMKNLMQFINEKNINNVFFSASLHSWLDAHKAILKLFSKEKQC